MSDKKIPEEFPKILKDFLKDLLTTFPELNDTLNQTLNIIHNNDISDEYNTEYSEIIEFSNKVYPERFFDILYQNEEIFKDKNINTEFLPGIEFKIIWNHDDTSNKNKEIIWKYLQLILFIITNNISSPELFGDAKNLFTAVNEDEFKNKLEDTIKEMHTMFDMSGDNFADMSNFDMSGINMDNLPKPEEMHDHINGLMGGKIGLLAKEIAEEVANDLDIDPEDANNTNDIFKKLLRDPTKLMSLVKTVSKKLEDKIKSGEIKQSELLEEASDMINKMKNMPGMKNMQDMFKNMGVPMPPGMGGQGGSKMNFGAMEAKLNTNIKQAQMRERMLNKLKKDKEHQQNMTNQPELNEEQLKKQEEELIKIFSTGETVERTPRNTNKSKNAKKNKKKKPKN